jgi:hypothetical protein
MRNSINPRCVVLLVAVVIWFILFPLDLEAVLSPLKQISHSLSLGAYILISVAVICWTWKSTRTSSSK